MADAKIPNADRPAFPTEYTPQMAALRGLTKRECLAAMAMQGYLAWSPHSDGKPVQLAPEYIATEAVAYADALLAALGEPIP